MYGQGNYPPHHGQGSHTPLPPFQQRPVIPHFQHRPSSVTPPSGYSGPFQYQQPLPLPAQHGMPIRAPTSALQNAPHSYQLPPRPPQAHISDGAPQSYPPQQNTLWGRDNQCSLPPPPPPLAQLPSGPNRPEMFRPSVPPRGFAYTPIQLPPPLPPPPPTSSFFTPAPMFSTGPTPPPLPPSSPPPIPPSPPPTISHLSSEALGTSSKFPQIPKPDQTSIFSVSETIGSDSGDKVASTFENVDDMNMATDSKDLIDKASAEVGSSAFIELSSREYRDLDLPPPPPKPTEENVVKKIEVMCDSIAKNGLGFECITRQKESANPEFRFLFGGELGSEAAVTHEYFKWVRKKCLLQRKQSNSALKLPNMGISTETNPMDADVSPSVSDMEMEDDFAQPDEVLRETAFIPEECDNLEQLCEPQNVERSPPDDTVSTFSQLVEEEKATGFTLFHQNDQPMHGKAFLNVDSFNTSPAGAAKHMKNSNIGVSSSSPLEDANPIMKSPGELDEGSSSFRLLQDYNSDHSSEHDDKPSIEDVIPVTVLSSNTESNTSLHGDVQSNFQAGLLSMDRLSPELAFDKSSESVAAHSLPTSPSKDQELLPKSTTTGEANIASTLKRNKEDQESNEAIISTKALGVKDSLQVVHEVPPEKRKPQLQKEDVQHTSTYQKVDEFGRLVRDVASDSDSDESHHTRRHGKRSRSRSPHDRRRSRWSPRKRRERRSVSRSWSPQKRRSRSRSPSYRRGGESGAETVRRDKCFDFLRGRCYRGASCRYMHQEMDKSAGASYNRSTRTSVRHEETEKIPSRRSIHEQDLPGSSDVFVKSETMDHDDKSLVADFCKSERLSETTVLESKDMKEEILESTINLHDIKHFREKEETGGLVIDKSHANTSVPVITSTTSEDQIEIREPDLNMNASINSNQGTHLELPAPQSTSIPPPQLPEERFQPSLSYPYQAQSQMQPPHYPAPPNPWPLPPPPALPTPLQQQFTNNFTAPTAIRGVPLPSFQHTQFPARNDYRMFQQHSYPAPSSQTEASRSKPYGGAGHHLGHLSSFPVPSMDNAETSRTQFYQGNSFPSNEFSAPSSQSQTYIQQQQPHYSLHQPSSDGLRFGAYANINAPFGGSKIAHHYNPYASTFDQPFDSKFSSNVLNQGKDLPNSNPLDASDSLSRVPLGARAVISPSKIAQTAELPKSGSNQYDPLFDSIEPSSNSFKKIDQSQGLESALRLSSPRKPLDVGESYKQKKVETAAISTSTKSNAEFGETADAEVGEVESGRSSNPLDGGPTALGEVEIDQVKTPGKGKKSRDSRSMKLFKSSLAEYVKEVLKPHWRQGGMSKEAFKIIVKKTIDKVCGAMKSHHIPKSQEKVNRYIDSSERKLNKLVMGYVDKYAKI